MKLTIGRCAPRLVIVVTLLACTSSAIDEGPGPTPEPSADLPGITLVLETTHGSSCCRIFTMNPGPALTVVCSVAVLDAAGRLILNAVVPPKAPGHLRSSGFEAPAGRHGQGVLRLPIDLAADSYTGPCRPAAWHGGAPI